MASIKKRLTAEGRRADGRPKTERDRTRYDVRWHVGTRVASRTFARRADADAFKRQVEHDELRGFRLDPRGARITFSDWWDIYWPSTMHLRATTRASDESMYRKRIRPALGDLTLDRIDRQILRGWVADLSKAGLAPMTVAKCSQIVGKVLSAAVDDGRLGRNPADRLDLPRVERKETKFLWPVEVDRLAATIDPEYRNLVLLSAYGGLRVAEMLAFKVGRVDTTSGRVEVLATLSEVRGRLVTNPPKTAAGRSGRGPSGPGSGSPRSRKRNSRGSGSTTSATQRLRSGSPLGRARRRSPLAPVTRRW